jgi:hypothetical protein
VRMKAPESAGLCEVLNPGHNFNGAFRAQNQNLWSICVKFFTIRLQLVDLQGVSLVSSGALITGLDLI